MTREEAVEVLKERYLTCVGIGLDNHANRVNEALDMAIESLSTPSGDLISRADAIEILEAEIRCTDREEDVSGLTLAKLLIFALPSADAVQGWITDRNPTENGTYIVTIADEDGGFVCELHYGEPLLPICKVNGSCWYDSDDEFGDCPYYDIIAWMPLPTPYRERREP